MNRRCIYLSLYLSIFCVFQSSGQESYPIEDLRYENGLFYHGTELYSGGLADVFPTMPEVDLYSCQVVDGVITDILVSIMKSGNASQVVTERLNDKSLESIFDLTVYYYSSNLHYSYYGNDGSLYASKYSGIYHGNSMIYYRIPDNSGDRPSKFCHSNLFDEILGTAGHMNGNYITLDPSKFKHPNDTFLAFRILGADGKPAESSLFRLKVMNEQELDKLRVEADKQLGFEFPNNEDQFFRMSHFLLHNQCSVEFLGCVNEGMKSFPRSNALRLLLWIGLRNNGWVPGAGEFWH